MSHPKNNHNASWKQDDDDISSSVMDNEVDSIQLAFQQFMLNQNTPNNNNNNNNSNTQESNTASHKKKKSKKKGHSNLGKTTQQLNQAKCNTTNISTTVLTTTTTNEVNKQSIQLEHEYKKSEKRYWTIFKKFQDTIVNEWIDIDNQLENVILSIASYRSRIPIENRFLKSLFLVQTSHASKPWTRYGFTIPNTLVIPKNKDNQNNKDDDDDDDKDRMNNTNWLNPKDVELALSYDLLQHEKMMEGIRSLMANLSECHELLTRQLDEMMKHHLFTLQELGGYGNTRNDNELYIQNNQEQESTSNNYDGKKLVKLMNDIYVMFSNELYRKQCLVTEIFNSVNDESMFDGNDDSNLYNGETNDINNDYSNDDDDDYEMLGSRRIFNKCRARWARSCKVSCIDQVQYELFVSLGSNP